MLARRIPSVAGPFGARGVGDSTNRGVVLSMVMIIILDFFLMNIIDVYYKATM